MKSIKDVANLAGLSVATVSRVLSGRGYASDEARAAVEQAVRKLNYRPNRIARSLREQRSRVIGLIVSDIRNPFFSEITKSVEDVALANGYSVLICNTNEDVDREEKSLHLMADEKVAGVLISPTLAGCKRFGDYTSLNLPMVVFDRKPSGVEVDSVMIDNVDSAARLTQSLLDAGHRRVVGIFGQKSYTAIERLRGFRETMSRAGLEPAGVFKAEPVVAEGERVIADILNLKPQADAVMCSSALLAIGAYKAMRLANFKPGFACFDDAAWTAFAEPPVTVIRQPTELIGATATELLIKRIADPSRALSAIVLTGELIDRFPARAAAS